MYFGISLLPFFRFRSYIHFYFPCLLEQDEQSQQTTLQSKTIVLRCVFVLCVDAQPFFSGSSRSIKTTLNLSIPLYHSMLATVWFSCFLFSSIAFLLLLPEFNGRRSKEINNLICIQCLRTDHSDEMMIVLKPCENKSKIEVPL